MVEDVLLAIQSCMRHAEGLAVIQLDGANVHFEMSIQQVIDQERKVDGFDINIDQEDLKNKNNQGEIKPKTSAFEENS